MERERDYSFEALVEVCGLVLPEITEIERGRLNRALKQLREVHSDDYILADLIFERAKMYRTIFADATLTPQALAGNWSQLPDAHHEWEKAQVVVTNVYAPIEECETCNGDKLVVYSTRAAPAELEGHDLVYEEMAACPSCNAGADTGFWRYDGSHFTPPSPAQVQEKM